MEDYPNSSNQKRPIGAWRDAFSLILVAIFWDAYRKIGLPVLSAVGVVLAAWILYLGLPLTHG